MPEIRSFAIGLVMDYVTDETTVEVVTPDVVLRLLQRKAARRDRSCIGEQVGYCNLSGGAASISGQPVTNFLLAD